MIRQYKTLGCVAIFLLAGAESIAADWQSLWRRPDQQAHQKLMDGLNLYQQGDYEQAQKEFATVGDETAMYNQGVTAVKQGEYEGAIEKFESVLNDNPAHENARHNLEIAKELAEKQQQQQQQQQGDQGDQDQQDEGEEQQSDNTQDGEQQQGQDSEQQGEGEQQGDAQSADTEEQQEKNQQGGELASDTQDVADKNEAEQAAQSAEQKQAEQEQAEQEQAVQSQQGGDQQGDPESDEQAAAAELTQAPTEGEQATEQWLRRIQDDPSQLLRNKIKLNHMIEHADVRDMQEPW